MRQPAFSIMTATGKDKPPFDELISRDLLGQPRPKEGFSFNPATGSALARFCIALREGLHGDLNGFAALLRRLTPRVYEIEAAADEDREKQIEQLLAWLEEEATVEAVPRARYISDEIPPVPVKHVAKELTASGYCEPCGANVGVCILRVCAATTSPPRILFW